MTVACIAQARLGSTRLPAKVLLPLPTGRTVLEEVIFRCRQIKGVDVVVVAVAEDAGSDIVADHAMKARFAPRELGPELTPFLITRGPEHDVLKRYVMAAEEVNADIIMRVTADCPLIHPAICAAVLARFNEGPCNYASNVHPRSYPQGYDCEVFSSQLLELADRSADIVQREHVTTWMVENAAVKKNLKADVDQSHIRWTLDTIEDYVTIWKEFERRASHKEAA